MAGQAVWSCSTACSAHFSIKRNRTRRRVEELFFQRNVTKAIAVGQARGVLLLALAEAGLPVGEYSPPG